MKKITVGYSQNISILTPDVTLFSPIAIQTEKMAEYDK